MSASNMNSLSNSKRFLLHPAHAAYFSTSPGDSPTGFDMRRPKALYNVLLPSMGMSLLVISLIFWRSASSIGLTWDSNCWCNLRKDRIVVCHACQCKSTNKSIYLQSKELGGCDHLLTSWWLARHVEASQFHPQKLTKCRIISGRNMKKLCWAKQRCMPRKIFATSENIRKVEKRKHSALCIYI